MQLRPQSYNGDFKQPAPNLGFAWNPDFSDGFLGKLAGGSNLVIRGGIAVNHYDEGWIPWENVATGSISNQTVSLNPGQWVPGVDCLRPNRRLAAGTKLGSSELLIADAGSSFNLYSGRLFQHG